jgi:AcrR family transcriptional regulator
MGKKSISRHERKARTRSRVLRAALELFSERGYEATTTADIAVRAGVAHGTVFVVAPTKDDLLAAAFQEIIQGVVDEAAATLPDGLSLLEQLVYLFGKLFDYYAVDPALSRVLIPRCLFLSNPDSRQQQTELLRRFLSLLEKVIENQRERAGLRTDVSGLEVAGNCFAVYFTFLLALLNDRFPSRLEHRRAFLRQLKLCLEGVLA